MENKKIEAEKFRAGNEPCQYCGSNDWEHVIEKGQEYYACSGCPAIRRIKKQAVAPAVQMVRDGEKMKKQFWLTGKGQETLFRAL
jgi:ssDNA-binding Zn-finger/Zn-ribbon topoisomerase 1